MDKVKLILKRIISYALVLFGLSILIFVLVRVMPGDTALGARASEEAVEALRQEMHLNESCTVWILDFRHAQRRFWRISNHKAPRN